MLSVGVDKPNSMALCERPMPEPQAGEVRVRDRYAGISGSDLLAELRAQAERYRVEIVSSEAERLTKEDKLFRVTGDG